MEQYSEEIKHFINYSEKCRLCIGDPGDEDLKIRITEDIETFISDLHFELISTRSFSNFICTRCHQNLQLFINYRKFINEMQQKLKVFLNGIKDESIPEQVESNVDPIYYSSVDIKSEPVDEEEHYSIPTVYHQPEFNYHPPVVDFYPRYEDVKPTLSSIDSLELPTRAPNIQKVSKSKKKTESNAKTGENSGEKKPKREMKPYWKCMQIVPCSYCGKTFKQKSLLKHIEAVHEKKKKFFCDMCGQGFYQKPALLRHVFRHIPMELRDKNFKCTFCPREYYCYDSLHQHIISVHNKKDKRYECECGKVYKNIACLYQHKRNIHEKEKHSKTCEICGKVLKNTPELNEHMQVYHTEGGRGNYVCSDCGRRFDTSKQIQYHAVTHMEKIFACDEPGCDKRFPLKHYLARHMRMMHATEKQFVCDKENCGKAFINNFRLQRHIRVVHDKLKCPVGSCDFMNGRRDHMKSHLDKHTELEEVTRNALMERIRKDLI